MSEPSWLPEAKRLRETGMSYRRIAGRVGATHRAVYHWVAIRGGARTAAHSRACVQCGELFPLFDSTQKFCSRTCFFTSGVAQTGEAKEKRRRANQGREGEANPNYRNGRRVGRHIRGWSAAVKGESCCRNCGATGTLHLHHAIPRSLSRAARTELLNGIPLCPTCHRKWHTKTLTIYRDVFTPDEWAYISSVQLTGQRIEAWLDDHYPARTA